MFVATKVAGAYADAPFGLRATDIIRECERSLRRLRTDVIDLYYAHADDRNTPVEEIVSAFHRSGRRGQGPLHRAQQLAAVAAGRGPAPGRAAGLVRAGRVGVSAHLSEARSRLQLCATDCRDRSADRLRDQSPDRAGCLLGITQRCLETARPAIALAVPRTRQRRSRLQVLSRGRQRAGNHAKSRRYRLAGRRAAPPSSRSSAAAPSDQVRHNIAAASVHSSVAPNRSARRCRGQPTPPRRFT